MKRVQSEQVGRSRYARLGSIEGRHTVESSFWSGQIFLKLGAESMRQILEDIVRALVDQPDEVQIKEVIGEHAHVLELRVAKEDLGKVIGKGGSHASAIRTLMAAASGKEKKRYILEIIEN